MKRTYYLKPDQIVYFLSEILYSISSIMSIVVAIQYYLDGEEMYFIFICAIFGLKRLILGIICLHCKLKYFLIWLFDTFLLGFINAQFYDYLNKMFIGLVGFTLFKFTLLFLVQIIFLFCYKLISNDSPNGYVLICNYVSFLICLVGSVFIFIKVISRSNINPFNQFINITTLFLSITCLSLFEMPIGNNIAYYEILIIIGNYIIINILSRKRQFTLSISIFSYFFMNWIKDEQYYASFNDFHIRYLMVLRYFSQLIRLSLIVGFSIPKLISLNSNFDHTADAVQVAHIIITIAFNIIFFIVNVKSVLFCLLKIKSYQISIPTEANKLAKTLENTHHLKSIQIAFNIKEYENQYNNSIQQPLVQQEGFVNLFRALSDLQKRRKNINVEIIWLNDSFYCMYGRQLLRILKEIEFLDITLYRYLFYKIDLLEVINERQSNGLALSSSTLYMVQNFYNIQEQILLKQQLVSSLVVTAFTKYIQPLMSFSPKQIMYDLHQN